jgi:serine/threonine-protein kinase
VHGDNPASRDTLCFGPFEWDPARARLRRDGVRIKLGGQPLEVLTILVEQADRLVTRDELRHRLWNRNEFVDFDQGLNTAIARLRHALGDSAERPHFIETVAGRGYRFIAPVIRGGAGPSVTVEAGERIHRRTWLAGGLGLTLGAAGAFWLAPSHQPPARMRRFVISAAPSPALVLSNGFQDLAISQDGRTVAYRTSIDGAARLYMRPLDRPEGRLLPDADVYSPFFSPDGRQIGYYRFIGRALLRASVLGGPSSRIADVASFVVGASWSTDGSIVFGTLDASEGLCRVAETGGRIEMLTSPEPGVNHVLPEVLPDGLSVLFTIVPVEAPEESRIALLDLRTGMVEPLLAGSHPRYAKAGYLIYVLGNELMAVPFDMERGRVARAPAAVIRGLATATGTLVPTGQYSLSRDGSLLVAMGTAGAQRKLVWVDRDGAERDLGAPPRGYTYPRVSPDGGRIALNVRDAKGGSIELWDVRRGDSMPARGGPGLSLYPVWAPDGQSIIYGAGVPLENKLYRQLVEGGAPGQPIEAVKGSELRALYFLSPTGTEFVFARQGRESAELMIASLVERGEPRMLLRGARNAELSPDGSRIAYQSDESGQFEVFVRSFPDVERYYMNASSNGGIQPLWSPSGDELFYIEPGPPSRLMSVGIEADPRFTLAKPRPLLDWPYHTGELGRTYDVSRPDGSTFLAVTSASQEARSSSEAPRAEILLDWIGELEATELSAPL